MATTKQRDASSEDEARGGEQLIADAAAGKHLSEEEQASATDWLLSDAPEDAPVATKTMRVNVGTDEKPHWIAWTVRAVEPGELRTIQAAAARSARQRRGEPDEMDYHAKLLAVASIDPNVFEAAKAKNAGSASEFIKARFAHKPGLIPQLTAEVMAISGFDDAHVTEVEAGKH